MSISIELIAEGHALRGALYTSTTALLIVARLPLELELTRWGGEYFGDVGAPLGAWLERDARVEMQPGELAWWPPGNALCLFFDRTPASADGEPRAASAVNPIGRLRGDLSALGPLGERIRARLQRG